MQALSPRSVPPGQPAHPVAVAPYALVRLAAVDQPAGGPGGHRLRRLQNELVDALTGCQALAPALTDGLYRLGGEVSAPYRQSVLLPLRRSVHNGRSPTAAVHAAATELTGRLPALGNWLAARTRIDRLAAELDAGHAEVLAEERAALATLCGTEPVGRAVALTSPELLDAVLRTAARGGRPDARGRKSEPTVLRYALRATTRTSPLSWFTIVGWAPWPDAAAQAGPVAPDDPGAAAGLELLPAGTPTAVTRAPASLVASLFLAAANQPDRMLRTPHRLAPGLREDGGHIVYYREHPGTNAGGEPVVREERVRLPVRPALAAVIRLLRAEPAGRPPLELVAPLAGRTGSGSGTGPDDDGAAERLVRRFLGQLCAERMLVPVPPATEHDPAALTVLADWLHDTGTPQVADQVRRIDRDIRSLNQVDAAGRGPLVRRISTGWQQALAELGAEAPKHVAATEDVVLPRPVRLTRPPADPADLTALTGLALLFDPDQVLRRLLRHRFVDRYGPGGRCPDPGQFFAELGDGSSGELPAGDGAAARYPELAELTRLREQTIRAVRAGGSDGTETVIAADVLAGLVESLPGWLRARPASYAFFGQPDRDGSLCLNHVYGGWGRFTSRFLDLFADGGMRTAVAGQVRRMLPGRVAQFRPVHGFNANLHPLLVDEEISDDPRLGGLDAGDIELVHDLAGDQIRLLDPATGALLDVLYLGFLAPPALPARVAALLGDLGSGEVDLTRLAATRTVPGPGGTAVLRDRLRYGRIVLARRSWRFDPGAGEALRATAAGAAARNTAAGAVEPMAAIAGLRAGWGLPDQVFLRQGGRSAAPADALRQAVTRPKPQFVDLASPLHLRCLPRWLGRIAGPLVIEEALPRPVGHTRPHRLAELVLETYLPEVRRA